MRHVSIISGRYKGRRLRTPPGFRTHPMSERVRNALFNMLGDITDLTVLDPYGGSGAVGFEALSRGASFAQIIDKDRQAVVTMQENAKVLGVGNSAKITQANAKSWSERNPDEKFDIVICDPPYDDVNLSTVLQLTTHLKTTSIMVLSHSGRVATPTVNGVVVVDNHNYGDAALSLYRLDTSKSE